MSIHQASVSVGSRSFLSPPCEPQHGGEHQGEDSRVDPPDSRAAPPRSTRPAAAALMVAQAAAARLTLRRASNSGATVRWETRALHILEAGE